MKQLKSSIPCLKKIPYKFQRKSLNSTPFYEIKTLAQKRIRRRRNFPNQIKNKENRKNQKNEISTFPFPSWIQLQIPNAETLLLQKKRRPKHMQQEDMKQQKIIKTAPEKYISFIISIQTCKNDPKSYSTSPNQSQNNNNTTISQIKSKINKTQQMPSQKTPLHPFQIPDSTPNSHSSQDELFNNNPKKRRKKTKTNLLERIETTKIIRTVPSTSNPNPR